MPVSNPPVPPHTLLHYFVNNSGVLVIPILLLCPTSIKSFAVFHFLLQTLWFTIFAGIPAMVTKVMFWVDFAWPWGLCLISACVYWYTSFDEEMGTGRRLIICGAYALHGARMGAGAIWMIGSGTWNVEKDLPRYQFQKIRVEKFGWTWDMKFMQKEIYQQMFANAGVLFVPCLVCALDKTPGFGTLEIVGYVMWAGGWVIENIADTHKLAFVEANKKKPKNKRAPFCNAGLWKYSRHPNYFGEWVAWCGLAVAAAEPVGRMEVGFLCKLGLYFILAYICMSLYYCLSEWTGAVPAEYFSVQKREGYDKYMKTTSMIVPWFVKELEEEEVEEEEEVAKEDSQSKRGRSRGASKRTPKKKTGKPKKKKEATPKKKEATPKKEEATPTKRSSRSKTPSKETPKRTKSVKKSVKKSGKKVEKTLTTRRSSRKPVRKINYM